MLIIILTAVTVVTLVLVACTVFSGRYSRIAQIAFFIGSLSTAVVISGDSLCILRPTLLVILKRVVFTSETIMVTSWLLFSVSFARFDFWGAMNKYSKLLLMVSPVFICFFSVIPVEDFFYSPEFEIEKILFLEDTGYIFNILLLLYSVVSVINLEATLRSSLGTGKWQIKYILKM